MLCNQSFDACCSHIFFNKWSDPASSLCGKLGYLRFSNHIYLGQENLRCLCLTRWLANQGWLLWGLGHPKWAANIIEPCSTLVYCYLSERRYLTQWKFWKWRDRLTLWQEEARSYFWVTKKEFKTNILQSRFHRYKVMRRHFKQPLGAKTYSSYVSLHPL